ncbi:alpha/beta fold hydrolase [Streptomyces mirabilis]|uniref:alpha/beta fold hydrolase n=1 Tax=Streptomyces mirabilis TaxID=68239 RepID=UPI0036B93267
MDALGLPCAVLAGYDWGGHAANIVAALWPERCAGLVSVKNYLIRTSAPPLDTHPTPILKPGSGTATTSPPNADGAAGIAEVIRRRNSPD